MTRRESRSSSITAIEEIAEYVSGFRGSVVPDEVRGRAALVVADTVGCMVSGARQHHTATYHNALRVIAGAEQASVVGTSWRADVATAATANCVSADALEYSDSLLSHPALTAVPVALAFGEWLDRPGCEVLDAVIFGYEAGVRFGRALVTPGASGPRSGRGRDSSPPRRLRACSGSPPGRPSTRSGTSRPPHRSR